MPDKPWESERLTRLRRERSEMVKKRDELQADVTNYNGAIYKLDSRIKEEEGRVYGPQATWED